jgi:penicillin-binding protein 1C
MNEHPEEDPGERLRRLLDSEGDTRADITPPAPRPAAPQVHTGQPVNRGRDSLPPLTRPALDSDNMPLPRRVDQIDMEGTRVTPAAYGSTTHRPSQARRYSSSAPFNFNIDFNNMNWRKGMGCLIRGLIVTAFLMVITGICIGSFALYEYYSIARALPAVDDLKERASQFETTRILDRNGSLLYEILDPNAGRRTYVTLDKISPNVIAATIATEDQGFYSHAGFDPAAIARALWENYRTDGQGGGASTITQQLARALLLSAEERAQRTYSRKTREIILAAEITRRYSKDEILELYLNEIYYGNLAYGIQAAAETYFGKSAADLTLGEASFLAGLPQSPAVYDIYTNRDAALIRQQQVLVLMFELSQQQGCIEVSNSDQPVCVEPIAATEAASQMKTYTFRQPTFDMRYPHWVNYVRSLLEEQYDAQTIYRSGFTIYTTLDPVLQNEAQRLVTEQVATLVDKNATGGALVAIKPSTGEILAMVGSPDFYNEAISGQVNMAVSPTRQPGSSIKPINYVAAFEKGWTPATLIWDVPSEFPPSGDPNDTREPYRPVNYDGRFHGPVTVRVALSNSFNMPAVKTLDFVGVYGEDGMIEMAERLGITSFTREDYGLALTLGGGDVSLLDMTSAFSVFANSGQRMPPVAISRIVDFQGNLVYEYQPPAGEQVIRADHAYLISSILSDNEARSWMFGRNSMLNLPFTVAAKTGTTNDFRDNWTLGYTPDLVTGVWIGNADYTPMVNTTGLTGAAPIWSQFMQFAVPYVSGGSPTWLPRPPGIVDKVICTLSGTEPSNSCRQEMNEIFASDQPPLPRSQDLVRRIQIDKWTELEASDACDDYTEDMNVLNVTDKFAQDWLDNGEGRAWLESNDLPRNPVFAPERECRADDPHPELDFVLSEGQVITDASLEIRGTADATGLFESWVLEYGTGSNPGDWITLNSSNSPVRNSTLHMWNNLSSLPNGTLTLRLTVRGKNSSVEEVIHLTLSLPTPTSPPTAIPPTDVPPTAIPPTAIPPTEPLTVTPPPTNTDVPPPSATPTTGP